MPRLYRPSKTATLLVLAWAGFCGWVFAGWSSVHGLVEAPYEVVRRADGYEVRRYGPLMAATVSVAAPWSEAYEQGFALLSAYAGGNNTTAESVAAGRPEGQQPHGMGIAESVPVYATQTETAWSMSFFVPSKWTEVTLPRPNDPRIRVARIPERAVAVLTFSGSADRERASRTEGKLRELLGRDKVVILGPAIVAQYHPSWAPSFLRRNEIIIPVDL